MLRRPLKPGPIKDQWIGGLNFEPVFDYGYDGVMRSFEDSLQRLGINSIDLLLVHDLDVWTTRSPPRLDAYFHQLVAERLAGAVELRDPARSRESAPASTRSGTIPRFLDLFDIDFFLRRDALHAAWRRTCSTANFRAAPSAASES